MKFSRRCALALSGLILAMAVSACCPDCYTHHRPEPVALPPPPPPPGG